MPSSKGQVLSDLQFSRRIDAIIADYKKKISRLHVIEGKFARGEYVMVKTWRKPYIIKKTNVAGGHVFRLKKVVK